jgi:hypothetical protein
MPDTPVSPNNNNGKTDVFGTTSRTNGRPGDLTFTAHDGRTFDLTVMAAQAEITLEGILHKKCH